MRKEAARAGFADLDMCLCVLVGSRRSAICVVDHGRDGLNLYKGRGSLWRILFSFFLAQC